MNTYRVDRSTSRVTPCGMNSILYVGDSVIQARKVFAEAKPGLDPWNKPSNHGVLFSCWCDVKRAYVPLKFKGVN